LRPRILLQRAVLIASVLPRAVCHAFQPSCRQWRKPQSRLQMPKFRSDS
jgi:hypothetical protein